MGVDWGTPRWHYVSGLCGSPFQISETSVPSPPFQSLDTVAQALAFSQEPSHRAPQALVKYLLLRILATLSLSSTLTALGRGDPEAARQSALGKDP